MVEIEKLQEKLGEALGLEIAAQKAVEELGSKGLLDENGMLIQLEKMRSQAGDHQLKLEEGVQNLTDGSDERIQQKFNKLRKKPPKSVQV